MTIRTLEIIHKAMRDEAKRAIEEYEAALKAVKEFDETTTETRVPDELTMRVYKARRAKDMTRGALAEFERQDFR